MAGLTSARSTGIANPKLQNRVDTAVNVFQYSWLCRCIVDPPFNIHINDWLALATVSDSLAVNCCTHSFLECINKKQEASCLRGNKGQAALQIANTCSIKAVASIAEHCIQQRIAAGYPEPSSSACSQGTITGYAISNCCQCSQQQLMEGSEAPHQRPTQPYPPTCEGSSSQGRWTSSKHAVSTSLPACSVYSYRRYAAYLDSSLD